MLKFSNTYRTPKTKKWQYPKLTACSSTLLTPLVAACGHSACARCWARSPDCCPLCAHSTAKQKIRPNLPLAKRAAAVLRLANAFQKLAGVEVNVSPPSSGVSNFPKADEDSEDWFYQKDKKFSKKYEKKNRESTINILRSVSQDEPPLVFPGEVVDVGRISVKSSDGSKPDAVDKVKGWLQSSQNHFESEEIINTQVPPRQEQKEKVFVNETYEDFFTKKIASEVLQVPQTEPGSNLKLNNPKSLVPSILKDFVSEDSSECSSGVATGPPNDTLMQRKGGKSISEVAVPLPVSVPEIASHGSSHSLQNQHSTKLIINNDIEMHSDCSSKTSLISTVREKASTSGNSIENIPETAIQRETSYRFTSRDNDNFHHQKLVVQSDIEILHPDVSVPFVRRNSQTDPTAAKSKKVPFFYKSKCNPNISCTEQQDGLNIEITRDNVVTTIVIRNHPLVQLSGKGQCHVKVARTRDAQTSPIPFLKVDGATEGPHKESSDCQIASSDVNSIPATQVHSQKNSRTVPKICGELNNLTRSIKHTHVNSCTDTYEITESLEKEMKENELTERQPVIISRAPSAILASSSKVKTLQQCVPSENNSAKLTEPPVSSGEKHEASQTENVLDSSPPLQVTGPDEPSFKPYSCKKRKCSEEQNDGDKLDPKKAKTDKIFGELDDNLIISFESETQKSSDVRPLEAVPHTEAESERMNYDEIIGTVFANIDKDLKLNKNTSRISGDDSDKNVEGRVVSKKIVEINGDTQVLTSRSVVQCPSEMFEASERATASPAREAVAESASTQGRDGCSQNKEDVTDLRNLSMDMEPDIKFSENMFSTMYDRNTIAFSTQDHIPLANPILPETNSDPTAPEKVPQERTIELSPDEQMLFTPTMRMGESLRMRQSQEVDRMDSDSSMVEDTPPKPRKVSVLRKVQDKPLIVTKRPAQSDNADISDIRPLELSQVEKLTNEKISTEKVLTTEKEMGETSSSKKNNTPLSITKFTSDIKFRSTPMQAPARRSLNYTEAMSKIVEDDEKGDINTDDREIQCISEKFDNSRRSSTHTKTSIEREFLEQAFNISGDDSNRGSAEKSRSGRQSAIIGFTSRDGTLRPHGSQPKLLTKVLSETRNKPTVALEGKSKNTILCIATSCLLKDQVRVVREAVGKLGWKFTDQYSGELTHLVVRVDENNVSQRTVKYMQALADGKWIVSFDWIAQCIKIGKHVSEEKYEVLDSSGEMGPRLSRTSAIKLFQGITFYCLPPITTLKEETLIHILKTTGGVVVQSIEEVEIRDPKSVFVLLADPQNTQDDRYIDICLRHRVVPLNVEWALDCLGQGCLEGAAGYLLAPRSLLPSVDWPFSLASDESMEAAN